MASPNYCVVALTEELSFQMEPIRSFNEKLDANHLKRFKFLRYFYEMGLMAPTAHRVADLMKKERAEYENLLEQYKVDRYERNWEDVLKANLDYHEIQVVGDTTK